MRVGVCAAARLSRSEIAERLGVSRSEVHAAFERLRRVAGQLDVPEF